MIAAGPFTLNAGIAVYDYAIPNPSLLNLGPGLGAGFTQGATNITSVQANNPSSRGAGKNWSVNSFSVVAQVGLQIGAGIVIFGRLGKIFAGLTTQQATPQNNGVGFQPMVVLPLPSNLSMIAALFDPADDALPPQNIAFTPTAGLACQSSAVLSTPLIVPPGGVNVGIWIEPSLMSTAYNGNAIEDVSAGLIVFAANYTIDYDLVDAGQGPTGGGSSAYG